jgi:predicted anti-sigma-YlaC factor YlaD
MFKLKNRHEVLGGVTIAVFGVLAIVEGYRLGTGTLTRMEPGYVPLALGLVLVLLGFLMSVGRDEAPAKVVLLEKAEWRGWLCIIAGVAAFLVLGPHAGLVPAAFSCVFISALGDRTATLKGAFILALSVTAFGVILFHYFLTIPMSLFWW